MVPSGEVELGDSPHAASTATNDSDSTGTIRRIDRPPRGGVPGTSGGGNDAMSLGGCRRLSAAVLRGDCPKIGPGTGAGKSGTDATARLRNCPEAA